MKDSASLRSQQWSHCDGRKATCVHIHPSHSAAEYASSRCSADRAGLLTATRVSVPEQLPADNAEEVSQSRWEELQSESLL